MAVDRGPSPAELGFHAESHPAVDANGDDLLTVFIELREHLSSLIVGQPALVERLLVALLADGHVLLEGAPGLAKTRAARALAAAFDCDFRRIQFTPDLLPSDLTGSHLFDPQEKRFAFQPGPLFSHFLLADEINRAPAKVQSALLEAMEERQITSDKTTFRLEAPFFVVATQNPIEHDGTWELPQAQLDRFLLHLVVDYPSRQAERAILDLVMTEWASTTVEGMSAVVMPVRRLSRDELAAAKWAVAQVHVSVSVRDYVVRLISATRDDPAPVPGVGEFLSHPVSPRGSIALVRGAQALAWLDRRNYVTPDDVFDLAPDVLRHRMGLSYRAEAERVSPDAIVSALLDHVVRI